VGLNDVTRWFETRTGVTSSRYNFGGVNGYSEIGVRASELRRGTRFSYALTNRAYSHRLMLTHNTGMMANGWAFSISGSRRWAEEGYVPGTFYDAGAYFLSAEKAPERPPFHLLHRLGRTAETGPPRTSPCRRPWTLPGTTSTTRTGATSRGRSATAA
jgi:hypothetical protein